MSTHIINAKSFLGELQEYSDLPKPKIWKRKRLPQIIDLKKRTETQNRFKFFSISFSYYGTISGVFFLEHISVLGVQGVSRSSGHHIFYITHSESVFYYMLKSTFPRSP